MKPRGGAFALLLLVVGGVLLWLIAEPALQLLVGSFLDAHGVTLAGWRAFCLGAVPGEANVQLEALRNSLVISVGSVVLAALIGVPLAFCFQRYEFPGRRLFAALATVPVLLPPLVGVVAFFFLYSDVGVITRAAQALLRLDEAPWRFRGVGAVLVVHAYSMYVYFYVFVSAGLARLDEAQEEAAATLGAGPVRKLITVTLPLLAPALVGAALLVFMMSMASFTAPYVIGEVRVLTTQLLVSRQAEQLTLMRAETVVLTGACLVFLFTLRRLEGRGRYVGGSKGAGGRRTVIRAGWLRWLAAGLGVVAVLILLLPHAMLVLIGFAADASWTTQILPPVYTLANYGKVLADPAGRVPLGNSLRMAGLATAANLLWALPAAYLLGRCRFRGRGLLEGLAMLPWAIPGTVIALGLAELFSVHRPWCGRWVWIGTPVILPIAWFVRNVPVAYRATQASLAQVDGALEEAAATLGAGPVRSFGTVVLPLVLPGALAGAMLAWIAAMGEFVASVVLYTNANRPIAIEIWNQLRNAYFGRAAALGVILTVVVAVVLAGSGVVGRRDTAIGGGG